MAAPACESRAGEPNSVADQVRANKGSDEGSRERRADARPEAVRALIQPAQESHSHLSAYNEAGLATAPAPLFVLRLAGVARDQSEANWWPPRCAINARLQL